MEWKREGEEEAEEEREVKEWNRVIEGEGRVKGSRKG